MRIVFATNNSHKMSEIKDILGDKYQEFVRTMSDVGVKVNPDETGSTFLENAYIKSNALYLEMKKKDLIEPGDFIVSDDTGLCIDFLDGAPGIMSARFMGDICQEEKNNKILELMKGVLGDKRSAYFITELSVIEIGKDVQSDPKIINFEGKIEGYIAEKIEKTDGFGYDPIFAVGNVNDSTKGVVKTYSNLGVYEKNKISHRARALSKFVEYLEKNHNI